MDQQVGVAYVLQRISQVLGAHDIAEKHWIKVLVLVVEDVSAAQWISTNIVVLALSWKDACIAFTAHFQSSDYSVQLEIEYDKCKQGKTESVQSYADRYMELVHQLAYDEDSVHVIKHFVHHLSDYINRKYHDRLADKQLDDPDYVISSLDKIIKICIRLDVVQKTAAARALAHSGVSGTSSSSSAGSSHVQSSSSSGDKKQAKFCANHPQFSNHTTAECR